LAGPAFLALSAPVTLMLRAAPQAVPCSVAAVHLHMFPGWLPAQLALIGLDPVRHRPGTKTRLAALVVVGAAHDTLATLMHAHRLPAGAGSVAAGISVRS
jgi:hypothetical protein